jgi:hypothetical protein
MDQTDVLALLRLLLATRDNGKGSLLESDFAVKGSPHVRPKESKVKSQR